MIGATMTKLSLGNVTPVTGLIPAAGRASRLPGLPGSKELLLVPAFDGSSPCTAIENSVNFLLGCGIEHQSVVIAPDKTDIPDLLAGGAAPSAQISCTTIDDSRGVPDSLSAGLTGRLESNIVLVFPDIMFEPRAAIARGVANFRESECDVLLFLVPSARGEKVDMVTADASGMVSRIDPKPGAGVSGWTWVTSAWSPVFSAYLRRYVADLARADDHSSTREHYVGDVMNAAINDGLSVRSVKFPDGSMIDIGTPDDFATAWRESGQSLPPEVAAVLRNF
jgi:glucose-1-phosphate thymidylyltransferase